MLQEIIGIEGERPMVLATRGAVGTSGENFSGDVRLIQLLLNNVPPSQGGPSPSLAVDARCGPKTIAAIQRYQRVALGHVDGRIDARNLTIRHLVRSALQAGKTIPSQSELMPATPNDLAGARSMIDFPFKRIVPISGHVPSGDVVTGRADTGWGAPFTPSGWAIDNNSASIDISIDDKGIYAARLQVFKEKDTSTRGTLRIGGVFKGASIGPPFGADLALPSYPSTYGRIIRGISGIGPLSLGSFRGGCNFGMVGTTGLSVGASATLFQFAWGGPTPPGLCVGFTVIAGFQTGVPNWITAGGGVGVCV